MVTQTHPASPAEKTGLFLTQIAFLELADLELHLQMPSLDTVKIQIHKYYTNVFNILCLKVV